MKRLLCITVVLLTISSAWADAGDNYQNALKALAAKDYPTALKEFEAALAADPDNLRYGNEYRQAVIQAADAYDRCIRFFEKLTTDNPNAPNAWLNLGLAYVDKIPAAGTVTQVILANTALEYFTKSIVLKPTWISLFCRGNSYLFWPRIFNRTHLGVADLQEAMKMQKDDKIRAYHVRTYIALGQAHWKMDEVDRARGIWKEGQQIFPDSVHLKALLSKEGDDLRDYIDDMLDPNKRVDTDLSLLWADKN